MPEGDTIYNAAKRIRSVLEGKLPDEIRTPHPRHALERWPQRLSGRVVTGVDTHGKHLFLRFEGGLTLHSHLAMRGAWDVYPLGRRWRRAARQAWLVITSGTYEVVQFGGPALELMPDSRTRFDRRFAALGPDILADEFDSARFLARLRADDPTRGVGDVLLDQTTIAGIGNIWKAEGCWEGAIDPWRTLAELSDAEAMAIVDGVRPRMRRSADHGWRAAEIQVYNRTRRPCPRCGTPIKARGQGDANRTTFWCPGFQS